MERLLPAEDFATAWRIARPGVPLVLPNDEWLDADLHQLLDRLTSDFDRNSQKEAPISAKSLSEVQHLYLRYERELRALESALLQRVIADDTLLKRSTSELAGCEGFFTTVEDTLRKMLVQLGDRKRRLAFDEAERRDLSGRVRATREAAAHLQAFAVELVLPPALIETLTTREQIDETFLEEVRRFRNKLAFAGLPDVQRTAAYQDLRPVLDQLQKRVVARLGAFLLSQISRLEEPNTNIQILQQNVLLKYRYFVEFLQDVAPAALENIRLDYSARMSRVYLNYFRQYFDGLTSLQEPEHSLGDTLIVPATLSSSFASLWQRFVPPAPSIRLSSVLPGFWSTSRKPSGSIGASGGMGALSSVAAGTGTSFGAGLVQRLDVLDTLSEPPLVLAVVQNEGHVLPVERTFWSVGRMLLEIGTAERSFCEEFFGATALPMLEQLLQPARDQLAERFVQYAASATDLVGLLLCLRIVQAQRIEAHDRQLASMERYFTRAELTIIPRVKELLDANETSLVEADPRLLLEAALSSIVSEQDSETEVARRLHPVIQRYADLVQALLTMATRTPSSDAMTLKSLHVFHREINRILHGMAERFRTAQNRHVFLINQLGTIIHRLRDAREAAQHDDIAPAAGAGLDTLHQFLDELQPELETCMDQLADLTLMDSFRDFMALGRGLNKSLASGVTQAAEHWQLVLAEFRHEWKMRLQRLSQAIIRSFPNWEVGSVVLKRIFKQLRAYNASLPRLIPFDSSADLRALLVDDAALVFEMRRYIRMDTGLESDKAH